MIVGISLAAGVAAALFEEHGIDVGYAYNRKEAKDHGEGGTLVGAEVTPLWDEWNLGSVALNYINSIKKIIRLWLVWMIYYKYGFLKNVNKM